jgi:hypothetical protein
VATHDLYKRIGLLKHRGGVAAAFLAVCLLAGAPVAQTSVVVDQVIGEVDRLLAAPRELETEALLKALDTLDRQLPEYEREAPGVPARSQQTPPAVTIAPPQSVTGRTETPRELDSAEQRRKTQRTYRGVKTPTKEETTEAGRSYNKKDVEDARLLLSEMKNGLLSGEHKEALRKKWPIASAKLRHLLKLP